MNSSRLERVAVDAGFGDMQSLLSFTNVEILSKRRVASILALIAWSFLLPMAPYAIIFNLMCIGQCRCQL